jgi:hypothetical protein
LLLDDLHVVQLVLSYENTTRHCITWKLIRSNVFFVCAINFSTLLSLLLCLARFLRLIVLFVKFYRIQLFVLKLINTGKPISVPILSLVVI